MCAVRLPGLADVLEPRALGTLLGPVDRVEEAPFATTGYSGSRHTRVTLVLRAGESRAFVLKRTSLAENWVARFSHDDVGREEAWLHVPRLVRVGEHFALPYLASARAGQRHALLMEDLTASLFPDVREPLGRDSEDALLGALAGMHAHYWDRRALPLDLLATFESFLDLLGPRRARDPDGLSLLPDPMAERLVEGWSDALRILPPRVSEALARPAADIANALGPLPQTVVHGDAKVANFARMPDGRVAGLDWSLIGRAPAGADLGWYIAVNATRLARTREEVLDRYRRLLETRLGHELPSDLWERMRTAAIVAGARMLLWSKAWALRTGGERERNEWAWWARELERWAG